LRRRFEGEIGRTDMTLGTILIRADASVEVGTGHVMRCLALAQAWQDAGGSAVFAMAKSTAAIIERLAAENIEVQEVCGRAGTPQDVELTVELAQTCDARWIVADGYAFDANYQRRIKDAGLKLFWVDDNGDANHYFADLVLNQNVHAREGLYLNRDPSCQLLLGPRYAMLRREFNAWREWKREVSAHGRKALVTLGGSDPGNVTLQVVQALQMASIQNLEAIIVVGGSNPHFESIARAAESLPGVRLQRDAANMPELMAWADIAVSAAGATCWEMCLLGLPAILIDVAENQRQIAQGLARLAISIHTGSSESVSVEKMAADTQRLLNSQECRSAMSRRGRELVDGEGSRRVISELV
jgi:UDP-2,4-diacetamido-2,4,6-trideoxy-beta-L-altropyranose hydrolase